MSVFILKSTNGGDTWIEKTFLTRHYDEEGIGFVTDSLGWIGGWSTPSYQEAPPYETTDGGESWHVSDFGRNINRIRRLNDSLAYAAGMRVYRFSTDSIAVSFSQDAGKAGYGFALYQNYPNPFNPVTTLTYVLQRTSFVELRIFDLLGKEVATLVTGKVETGTHSIGFDVSSHSSGIYFARLAVLDDSGRVLHAQSRKLVVVR
jgi:hypothetical protein